MKSSDLKKGVGYAYFPSMLHSYNRPYHDHTCIIPLDTKVYHQYRDGERNLVVKPGRKAMGYGTDYFNHAGKPYIDACGVPCMVASNAGSIQPGTTWSFKLVPPVWIWKEWGDLNERYDAEAKRRLDEAAKRDQERRELAASFADVRTALATLGLKDQKEYMTAYGGILFKSKDQMDWLTRFIDKHHELVEEVKDLQYELED